MGRPPPPARGRPPPGTRTCHDSAPVSASWTASRDSPSTEVSTSSSRPSGDSQPPRSCASSVTSHDHRPVLRSSRRSEEHTSELQSRQYLVCRLLLEKKTKETTYN